MSCSRLIALCCFQYSLVYQGICIFPQSPTIPKLKFPDDFNLKMRKVNKQWQLPQSQLIRMGKASSDVVKCLRDIRGKLK